MGANLMGYSLQPPTKPSIFEVCNLENTMDSVIADIRDYDRLEKVYNDFQPEIVFHMAAQSLVRYSYHHPRQTYETNIMGTVNILQLSQDIPSIKAIVNVTSDKCYDNIGLEKSYKEKDPLGGDDPYSSSKGCAEIIARAYWKSFFRNKNNIYLASVRAGNVIGGGDWSEDRIVPDCIKAFAEHKPVIVRYPEAIRPWQHVLEPLCGYLLLAKRLYAGNLDFVGPWNFGPNKGVAKTVGFLVEQLSNLWGPNASWEISKNIEPYEALYLKLDSYKAKSKLGWTPKWDLTTVLEKTVECYKSYYGKGDLVNTITKQIIEYEHELGNEIL
jgi:CDP-glucose 4,6-dehydratase